MKYWFNVLLKNFILVTSWWWWCQCNHWWHRWWKWWWYHYRGWYDNNNDANDEANDGDNYDDNDYAWHIVAASSLRPKQTTHVPPGANLSIWLTSLQCTRVSFGMSLQKLLCVFGCSGLMSFGELRNFLFEFAVKLSENGSVNRDCNDFHWLGILSNSLWHS